MHDGMPYDPSQGQVQGHRASEVPKIALFKVLSPPLFTMAADHRFLNYGTISKFDRAGFLMFVLVSVSRDFELGGKLCAL